MAAVIVSSQLDGADQLFHMQMSSFLFLTARRCVGQDAIRFCWDQELMTFHSMRRIQVEFTRRLLFFCLFRRMCLSLEMGSNFFNSQSKSSETSSVMLQHVFLLLFCSIVMNIVSVVVIAIEA